jgi:uncharacterized repeat protein (TIGR01451 family)
MNIQYQPICHQANPRPRGFLWLSLFALFMLLNSPFGGGGLYAQTCTPTPSVMAKWDFNSNIVQCNGAFGEGSKNPIFNQNNNFYCPNFNAGCAKTRLGSVGHFNTGNFDNAICLRNFYDITTSNFGGALYDQASPIFFPKGDANFNISYFLPKGKAGCLNSFSLKILQKLGNGEPAFRQQGVAVYRNGVEIYKSTQDILQANVNGAALNFVFPITSQFCSGGENNVTYEIYFGLVEKINTDFVGYDDITIKGWCGGTSPSASITPNTCGPNGANGNGTITLANFGATNKYDISVGSTYTGTATYASGSTTIPTGGVITNTLANPATPQDYTVRVFTSAGCTTDLKVTLNPVICPSTCTSPAGTVAPVLATCTGTTANSDAQISITGVTNGDKVAYSTGATYTGTATYTTATALVAGAYTITALPNPASSQIYTVRIYNASNTCYKDYQVTLVNKDCNPTPCTFPDGTVGATPATCTGSVANSDAQINVSGVTNGDKAAYSLGATYTGTATYATATALVAAATNFTALPNPAVSEVYTVRIFNGKDGCYKDFPVTINTTTCVPTCTTPTGTVTPTQATCTGSTANNDASIAITGVTNGDKVAYSTGSVFSGAAYATATALVAGAFTFTALPNTIGGQIYTVRIYNAADACYRDYSVTINEKICVPACTKPVGTVTPTDATCTGTTPNNDAKIAITAVTNGDKVGYSTGTTYSGAAYATATTLVGNAFTITPLNNPASVQNYTIRVFNGSDACYKDYVVAINPTDCKEPNCTPPTGTVATPTDATCAGSGVANADAQVAVTGVTGGDKVGIYAGSPYQGPTYANATALLANAYTFTGLPNATGSQVYTVRVFNAYDDCFVDKEVTINEKICGTCQTAYVHAYDDAVLDAPQTNNYAPYTVCKDTKKINLNLAKSVSPMTGTTCPTGTDFVWTITLNNTGDMAATNIQVADIMPVELLYISSNPSVGTYSESAGWLIPTLAAGASATLTITTKATKAGTFKNVAEVQNASPLNDPNSTPGNDVTTEDDYATATITVTGSNTPSISKEFSPMLTKPNTPTRLTIKITNNETTPITLTADFIDNLPSTPAQMVIHSTPNLQSSGMVPAGAGIVATASGTSITIPKGTTLVPGLNQLSVEVSVPSNGNYCNDIAVGQLKTSSCDNIGSSQACITANSVFDMAPIVKKTMLPAVIQTGQNATLTITVENRNAAVMTLNQDFYDYLPTGLVAAGTPTSSCGGVSVQNGNTEIKIAGGTTFAANSTCTITVPVTSSTAGTYCNVIVLNSFITTVGTNNNLGNEDIAETCVTVNPNPCTTLGTVSIAQSPVGTITPNGTATLTASATGTGVSSIYSWSGASGTFSNAGINPTIWTAPATAGTYTVSLSINNNLTGYGTCTASAMASISVATPLTPCTVITAATATATPNSIATGASAALSVSATVAGTPSFSYAWAGTGGFSNTTQNPSTGALATAGEYSYTVTVTNSDGTGTCTITATTSLTVSSAAATCTPPTGVSVIITPTTIATGGSINLASASTGATNWAWSGGSAGSPFTSTLQNPGTSTAPASAGIYTYTVTASHSANATCTATATGTLSVSATPTCTLPTGVSVTITPTTIATGGSINLASASTGATNWSWSGGSAGSPFTSTLQNPGATTAPASAGTYTYTVTASHSANATCTATATGTLSVSATPTCTPPSGVSVTINPTTIATGGSINLSSTATGATNWAWSGGSAGSPFTSTLQNPGTATAPATAGTYTYTVTASHSANATCTATATGTLSVTVVPGCTMSATVAQSACNNNGTPTTIPKAIADDYFNVTITATNGASTGTFQVVLAGNVVGSGTYGTSTTVSGVGGLLKANGTSTYTLTIRDMSDNTCSTNKTTTAVAHCSTACPPQLCPIVTMQKN